MLILLLGWAVMAGAATTLAQRMPLRGALLVWVVVAGVASALGSWALSSQPVGQATLAGRLGYSIVHWGFRAGNGKLLAAALISSLVWVLVGWAVVLVLHYRAEQMHALLVLAWLIDALAFLYVVGLLLARRGASGSFTTPLLAMAGILVGLIAVSLAVSSLGRSSDSTRLALIVAGGPPLVISLGYGLFVVVTLAVGSRARWN
jgi:hypothetical protein